MSEYPELQLRSYHPSQLIVRVTTRPQIADDQVDVYGKAASSSRPFGLIYQGTTNANGVLSVTFSHAPAGLKVKVKATTSETPVYKAGQTATRIITIKNFKKKHHHKKHHHNKHHHSRGR